MTPAEHLARITALFPKFWHQYDAFRAHRDTLDGWPSWCYCPLAGADEPDWSGREPPKHPSSIARSTGAQGETIWLVGERVGAALREANGASSDDIGGSHASLRAHVRRAHWHTYWTGARGAQTARVRWLSPILVGAGDTVVTRHDVGVTKRKKVDARNIDLFASCDEDAAHSKMELPNAT